MRRKVRSLRPPYFPKTISCLAVIMGRTCDSGRNPGFDGRGKRREIHSDSERFTGRDRGVVPDQGSGLKMGYSFSDPHLSM